MLWLQFFVDAIASLEPRMSLAMQADGCRENWLQTEIMMFAAVRNIGVWTNYEPAMPSGKHDLAAYDSDADDASTTMVAEIKIMAGHFQPKCLVGARASLVPDLIPVEGQRRYVTHEEILAADHAEWGLIPDAARLLRHPCPNRYLILVLLDLWIDETLSQRRQDAKRQLHAAMDGVTFVDNPMKEAVGRFDGFTVKVWSL